MVINSICDPALFDEALFENSFYLPALAMTLQDMTHNHIQVLDSAGVIGGEVKGKLQCAPQCQLLYNALLRPERIVRVPADNALAEKIAEWREAGSASAAACSAHSLVDVLIADTDTQIAIKEAGLDIRKTCSIQQYPASGWKKKKMDTEKAFPIGGMSKVDFVEQVIRPVVRCAKKVTIIDKIAIKAAFGDDRNPSGNPSGSWESFRKSIYAVYDEWTKGLYQGIGTFEVITWPVTHVQNAGKSMLGDDLAEEFGRRLGISFKQLRVMFKREHSFREDMHDRYLITNQGFVLGFSKGFDLSSAAAMSVCDVYFRHHDNLIARLMSKTGQCGLLDQQSGR